MSGSGSRGSGSTLRSPLSTTAPAALAQLPPSRTDLFDEGQKGARGDALRQVGGQELAQQQHRALCLHDALRGPHVRVAQPCQPGADLQQALFVLAHVGPVGPLGVDFCDHQAAAVGHAQRALEEATAAWRACEWGAGGVSRERLGSAAAAGRRQPNERQPTRDALAPLRSPRLSLYVRPCRSATASLVASREGDVSWLPMAAG